MSNELVKVSQILAFDKPFENVKNIWIGEDNDVYFEFTSGKIINYYQTDYEICIWTREKRQIKTTGTTNGTKSFCRHGFSYKT